MQFPCLTNPVVVFHSALEFFQLYVDLRQLRGSECGDLSKMIDAEPVQQLLEDFANADVTRAAIETSMTGPSRNLRRFA